MNAQPPVLEQSLPPKTEARIRAAVMATTTSVRPSSRPRALLVAAALVLLLGSLGLVVATQRERPLVAAPAPTRTEGDQVVSTDRGPLTEDQTRTELAGCMQPEDPALREVIAARRLSDGQNPFRWVLYRNVDDQVVLCSKRLSGPTYGGVRGHLPSQRYPVVPLGGMNGGGWLPDQSTPDPTTATAFSSAQFFAARPEVATVQLRIVVDGAPGAWFSGLVQNGFVFVPVYAAGPVPLDEQGNPRVSYERRAFDRNGSPVAVR